MSKRADSDAGEAAAARAATIRHALEEAAEVLRAGGLTEARREAATLLCATIERDRAFLIAHDDAALPPDALTVFRERARRRAAGEPLQYITGRQEFYGLEFEVSAAVLIPRPETELLVEAALELLRGTDSPFLCDVGTGSGCIAVALAHERGDARGVGCDISAAALRVAERNARRHGVFGRLRFCESDCFSFWGDDAEAPPPRFDMIVSNPPYVAEADLAGLQREVRDHEPRVALTPGGDGLRIIRRLLADSPRFLKPGGHLLFEIGFNQHEAVGRLIDPRTWTTLDIRRDLQGIPRTVALRLNA